METSKLIDIAIESGADNAAVLDVDKVSFYPDFRLICKSNACGNYGHCHMCPPEVGDISDLIAQTKKYSRMLVFQSLIKMEDTFDYNEQERASMIHNLRALDIRNALREFDAECIGLGPGACPLCKKCSARMNLPCVFPEKALASIESYGIDVNQIAKLSGLDASTKPGHINFFGIILCNL